MNKVIEFDINKEPVDREKILEIEELCKNNLPINDEEASLLLKNLSYVVRKKIADYEQVNMDDYSYSYKCDLAQSMIYYYLQELNIKAIPINTYEVIEGVCGHSLILTTINEKRYLMDPTYIQFFSKENCDEKKFVIINGKICATPDPGYFIVNNKKKSKIATMSLLIDGYTEFTEEVAKEYGDSFFQTKQGTISSQIENNTATGSMYIKWLEQTKSGLSKTKEELRNMNLLIETGSKKQAKRK